MFWSCMQSFHRTLRAFDSIRPRENKALWLALRQVQIPWSSGLTQFSPEFKAPPFRAKIESKNSPCQSEGRKAPTFKSGIAPSRRIFFTFGKSQKLALLQEARPPSKAIEHAPRLLCAGELLTDQRSWVIDKPDY